MGAGALSPSLALSFCLQIINFREPVTLDFLDAELEDENKEEVGRPRSSFWGICCPHLQLQRALSLPWGAPHPKGPGTSLVGSWQGWELGRCPLGVSMMNPLTPSYSPSPLHPMGPRCKPTGGGCPQAHGQAL